jgi:hypothetical protein
MPHYSYDFEERVIELRIKDDQGVIWVWDGTVLKVAGEKTGYTVLNLEDIYMTLKEGGYIK